MHSDSRTALTVGIFQSICIGVATTKTHIPAVEYPNHSDEFKMEWYEKKCYWKGISVEIELKKWMMRSVIIKLYMR